MKILIEVPDNWLDGDKCDDLSFITRTCKQEVQKRLMDVLTEKAMKELKMPKITISRAELKRAVLDRMVEEKMSKEL